MVVCGPVGVHEAGPRGLLDYLTVLVSFNEKACEMKYLRNKGTIH
jgi:hypothetical protein